MSRHGCIWITYFSGVDGLVPGDVHQCHFSVEDWSRLIQWKQKGAVLINISQNGDKFLGLVWNGSANYDFWKLNLKRLDPRFQLLKFHPHCACQISDSICFCILFARRTERPDVLFIPDETEEIELQTKKRMGSSVP